MTLSDIAALLILLAFLALCWVVSLFVRVAARRPVLALFEVTSERCTAWFVAATEAEAVSTFRERFAWDGDDPPPPLIVRQLPADEVLEWVPTVDDDDGDLPPISRTAAEWIALHGPGLISTMEGA